jgi:hypothetical protein
MGRVCNLLGDGSFVRHFALRKQYSGLRQSCVPAVWSTDVLDMSRQQQLIHHVKGEQRRHSIIGKSFPRFGEGKIEKALWVTHEGPAAGARDRGFDRAHCARSIKKGLTLAPVNSIADWLGCFDLTIIILSLRVILFR